MEYHNPVLLKECIEGLNINPEGIYVDVTFGGGGHSREILKHLTTGKLYAFDQDEDAVKNKIDDPRFVLIKQNFRYLKNFLKLYNALPIDGLLADLGVSSHQFDEAERGFSIRFDAKLDMRMDQNGKVTAADVLNTYSEEELKRIFKLYGEVDNAGYLASIIFHSRKEKKIETVNDLKVMITKCVKRGKENQYYAQVFQALRIEVNKELEVLEELLTQSLDVLKPEGRLVVISYHSLEDRLVKNFMRSGKFEGEVEKDFYGNQLTPFKQITRKPIVPSDEELELNTRSRSAKLRVAEKK
ncbi:MAG: 16S rRNA (cytosine(1402)-N(4))-methyltransferase RsmH [Bacteroidetes bacterium]|nr:16S rRNA (cytosine(1402)-N(4))-methyltransferase RsmH [Bacteroidia bacterium]MBN8696638.1 16S rRNA (cytosine(1402)-N(4))-methyltransferase RsmH [Bacteroidota bacterium]